MYLSKYYFSMKWLKILKRVIDFIAYILAYFGISNLI